MSNTGQGKVSIVVPMYNVAATLDQCLLSIEAQSYADLQIICMNDGSTDEGSQIAHDHAARDPRIVVVDKANEGYGATCNRGIALADGEWVAIVEPDDYLDPTMYEKLVACAAGVEDAAGRAVDVVRCAYWRVFEPGEGAGAGAGARGAGKKGAGEKRVSCPYLHRVRPKSQPFCIGDGVELLLHHPAIWAGMYRREFLSRAGVRFREVPGAGWTDNPFLIETLCATVAVAYVDEPLYFYREHDLNDAEALAAKSPTTPLTRWNEMMDAVELLGVEDGRVLDALALRGVNYAMITVSAAGERAAGVPELVERSMARLEPQRVFGLAALSPTAKGFFARVRGVEAPRENKLARIGYLAGEAAYRVRTNGLGFVVENLRSRLNRL